MSGSKQKGFTLIEVMVALAIFAIAGGAVLKATFEHLRSLSSLEELTFATWVANNQMTEATLRSQIQWPLKNNQKGKVELAGKQWFWKQEIKKTQDASLHQVTIIVALDDEMVNEVTGVTSFLSKVSQ